MEDLIRKTMSLKALSQEGQIEALISTYGRDRDGDIMTREAFSGSDGKSIPLVWAHNWDQPIGKGTVRVTDEGAVFTGQFWLDTADGEQAYRKVKNAGDLQEYSIGFRIKDAVLGYEEIDGERVYTRTIKDLELFEASPVLVGAAYNTGTLAIKQAKPDIHDQLKTLQAEHKAQCELGEGCPLFVKPEQETAPTAREQEMRELEAVLGYRPLIADRA
jgi:HK97 family phage prohead protease